MVTGFDGAITGAIWDRLVKVAEKKGLMRERRSTGAAEREAVGSLVGLKEMQMYRWHSRRNTENPVHCRNSIRTVMSILSGEEPQQLQEFTTGLENKLAKLKARMAKLEQDIAIKKADKLAKQASALLSQSNALLKKAGVSTSYKLVPN